MSGIVRRGGGADRLGRIMEEESCSAGEGLLNSDQVDTGCDEGSCAALASGACASGLDAVVVPGSIEFAEFCLGKDRRSLGYRFVKRLFDIVFSGAVCLVGLVPGLFLAVAIGVDTKGSPIYCQERVKRGGKSFRIYKFRSMVADADNVEKYLNPEQIRQWNAERKVTDDPRVTRLGRFIRKTSIDEIPQFINVLFGDISILGPRPITYDELEWFGSDAAELLSVPAGITGLWQASERNGATFESGRRQAIELDYVRHAGFRMDVKCFFGTFGAMFGRRRTGR